MSKKEPKAPTFWQAVDYFNKDMSSIDITKLSEDELKMCAAMLALCMMVFKLEERISALTWICYGLAAAAVTLAWRCAVR